MLTSGLKQNFKVTNNQETFKVNKTHIHNCQPALLTDPGNQFHEAFVLCTFTKNKPM